MAAHIAKNFEVCIFGEFELLLKIDRLLLRLNLKQLCLGDLDHDLIAVGSRHCEVFLEDLNQVLNFFRQRGIDVLVDCVIVLGS